MGIMAILQIVFFVIGNIPKMLGGVKAAEEMFKGSGRGEEKKKQVTDGLNAVVDSAYEAGLPIDIAGREAIKDGLAGTVDAYVGYYNSTGAFKQKSVK